MEQKVGFQAGTIRLEGLLEAAGTEKGMVVSHPHPLYGGNMHSPVVETVARAMAQKGFATLRFNFRGVGQSEGRHDQGRGEQEDLLAAADFLARQGVGTIWLAGYSFGAWVSALAAVRFGLAHPLILVSPPVGFIPFEGVESLPHLKGVVSGEADDFAPVPLLERAVAAWNAQARLWIVPGADHFYSSGMRRLEALLLEMV